MAWPWKIGQIWAGLELVKNHKSRAWSHWYSPWRGSDLFTLLGFVNSRTLSSPLLFFYILEHCINQLVTWSGENENVGLTNSCFRYEIMNLYSVSIHFTSAWRNHLKRLVSFHSSIGDPKGARSPLVKGKEVRKVREKAYSQYKGTYSSLNDSPVPTYSATYSSKPLRK